MKRYQEQIIGLAGFAATGFVIFYWFFPSNMQLNLRNYFVLCAILGAATSTQMMSLLKGALAAVHLTFAEPAWIRRARSGLMAITAHRTKLRLMCRTLFRKAAPVYEWIAHTRIVKITKRIVAPIREWSEKQDRDEEFKREWYKQVTRTQPIAYEEGAESSGHVFCRNPYPKGSAKHSAWKFGREQQQWEDNIW